MLAELKMVCAKRKAMLSHMYEVVKQVDVVAAIWIHLETLAAQEQLGKLSDAVKLKYLKVFNPILHMDDLPMEVYCCIKLKDASKTITTRWKGGTFLRLDWSLQKGGQSAKSYCEGKERQECVLKVMTELKGLRHQVALSQILPSQKEMWGCFQACPHTNSSYVSVTCEPAGEE